MLEKVAPSVVTERASIDEVYMDISTLVEGELERMGIHLDILGRQNEADVSGPDEFHVGKTCGAEVSEARRDQADAMSRPLPQDAGSPPGDDEPTLHVPEASCGHEVMEDRTITSVQQLLQHVSGCSQVLGAPLTAVEVVDIRLAAGALVAQRLRKAILDQLGYTSSAGIAGNKLLAKIGSARHKPNQQTVVPPRAVHSLMADLPLGKHCWPSAGTSLGPVESTLPGQSEVDHEHGARD